jgi:pyrimidine deaminase RibD-like protein
VRQYQRLMRLDGVMDTLWLQRSSSLPNHAEMAMNLKTFLEQYKNPLVANVAATFADDRKLHYLVSDNPAIPAAVSFLENDSYKGKPIFTNLPVDHWLMTYTHLKLLPAKPTKSEKEAVKRQAKNIQRYRNTYLLASGEYTDVAQVNHSADNADDRQIATVQMPEFLQFRDVAAPLSGGLFAAAKGVADRGAALTNPKDRSPEEKVLQYYMLATFGLLSMCKEFAYKGLNNYVAAMVVGDNGKILSAGVNVGSYKHAEVSTLLSFFSRNGTDRKFPAKSIVFSTLCPCEQCIKYLEATRPPESVIYFSQMDTGESGKAGAEGGKSLELGKVTKPTQIALTKGGEVPDIAQVSVSGPSRSEIVKHGIAAKLGTCIDSGKSNIAGQLGHIPEAVKTIGGSIAALEGKLAKERTGTAADAIKKKVLLHIAEWLITAKM